MIEEAERRYPALNPDVDEITYPRSALRSFVRSAFAEGARWQEAQHPSLPTREQIAEARQVLYDYSDRKIGTDAALIALLALLQKGADR